VKGSRYFIRISEAEACPSLTTKNKKNNTKTFKIKK